MKIFGREIFKRENKVEERSNNGEGCCLSPSNNNFTNYGFYSSNKLANLATVRRCVEAISNGIAQLPIIVYKENKDGSIERFKEHPTYNLLNRFPSKNMTRFTMMTNMISDMLLTGNAYAYIERGSNGKVKNIHYLPSRMVNPIWNKSNPINPDIKYHVVGYNNPLEDWQVIHLINGGDGINGVYGISTLSRARLTLELGMASNQHAKTLFEKGGTVAGYIKAPSGVDEEQARKIMDSWNNNTDRNIFGLLTGDMSVEKMQISPVDAQMLETMKFNVIEICRFFNVNPITVFDYTHNSYSTLEATQLAFLTDTLIPIIENIELELERKLYNEFELQNIKVKFDTEEFVRADSKTQMDNYKTLFNMGCITRNELRKKFNLSNIEDDSETFMQVNMSTVENIKKGDIDTSLIDNNITSNKTVKSGAKKLNNTQNEN